MFVAVCISLQALHSLKLYSLPHQRGESRYPWKHGIAHRRNDKIGTRTYPRERHVSLTFRKVIRAA